MSISIRTHRGALSVLVGIAAAMILALAVPPTAADAATPRWTGTWKITSLASGKTGTSLAARQAEPDFSATYTFSTSCSWFGCTATVTGGPVSSNPTVPWPPSYRWTGSRWQRDFSWQWDCYQPGAAKVWKPARSTQYFTPQSGTSMTGRWTTTISGGPCNGTVAWNMTAVKIS
ncbi:Rv2253 family sensor-like surface protein [Gordonia sp. NPDC003950]